MTELTNGTWVVVADSEKALFMRNLTDHADPNFEIIGMEEPETDPDQLQRSDRPGRRADGGPGQSSAMEDTKWHDLARDRFAKDLAGHLYRHAHKGAFDRLVLVASPQVLGALRGELHSEVEDRIVAEIPKTLTNHPLRKLEALVKAELDGN